ncbi:MAG: hypothetical protein ABEH77_07460 [Halobacteriaceae archaeon]
MAGSWLLAAVRFDLKRLLAVWRALVFPRQLDPHPVHGPWRPGSAGEHAAFWLWSAVGAPLVLAVYPPAVLGFGVRYVVRKVSRSAAALGAFTAVALVALVWGGLSVVAWFRFPVVGFRAVVAASVAATVSAALTIGFARLDGRPVTVLLAYPFAVSTFVLPPTTAALYSPALGDLLATSETLAIWLLDNVLTVGNLNAYIREQFALRGAGFIGMWFAISVPVGWVLGLLVALADAIRP